MMKLTVTVFGLVALLCIFVMTVSGAQDGHVAAAMTCAAQRDHVSAARSCAKAAKQHHLQIKALKRIDDRLGVVESYLKAVASHKAAGEHARMHLLGVLAELMAVSKDGNASFVSLAADYADLGKCMQQGLMHNQAARRYLVLADEYAAAGKLDEALAMNHASAEQFEEGAKCARACGDQRGVAVMYVHAAGRHRAAGNHDKAQSMEAAAAEQYVAEAESRLGCGDNENAASFYIKAAKSYVATGCPEKARAMMKAAAMHYEIGASEPEIQGDKRRVAHRCCSAADAYVKLGQTAKALSLWRTAAENYEAVAIELEAQNRIMGAIVANRAATKVYDKIVEAQSMRDAASLL